MRNKKGGKSRKSEKQVSREAGKAEKHGKAERSWKGRKAGKSRKAEKQRGSTVEKQRSEEAKKQKRGEAEKQRIIKAEKNWEKQNSKKQKHTSKKMPKTEKNIFTPKITLQILTSSIIHRIGPEGDERRATRAGRRQKDRERERGTGAYLLRHSNHKTIYTWFVVRQSTSTQGHFVDGLAPATVRTKTTQ